jgi:hypothetical protein
MAMGSCDSGMRLSKRYGVACASLDVYRDRLKELRLRCPINTTPTDERLND